MLITDAELTQIVIDAQIVGVGDRMVDFQRLASKAQLRKVVSELKLVLLGNELMGNKMLDVLNLVNRWEEEVK